MTQVDAQTSGHVHREAIREVIGRYFAAVDRYDEQLLATCFTPDARYESAGGSLNMEGRDVIAARLMAAGSMLRSHIAGSMIIDVDGEQARADTYALAYLVDGAEAGRRVLVRGLRYEDQLRLEGGKWRIAFRHHSTQWQFETTTMTPLIP